MGITNTLGTIPGFIGPLVVGVITKDNVRSLCEEHAESMIDRSSKRWKLGV